MRLFLAATAASVCVLAGQAQAETYSATAVRLDDVAAVVTVIPEDRANVDIAISPGTRLPAPTVRMTGDGVLVDGDLDNRIRGCTSTLGGGAQARIAGVGNVRREEMAQITIRTPRTLDLSLGGVVYTTIGASAGGSVAANGCGDTTIAATSGALDVDLNGSGDVDVASVGGALAATLNGSGSLQIERAGADAALRLNGSGNLEVGSVAGRVNARLNGSGSLDVAAVGGDTRLGLFGSGDIDAGAVTGSLDAELHGSGSVSVASVTGQDASLDLFSSGSIVVRGGRVERLSAHNTGSGGVRFAGAAGATRARLSSSGSISIADAGQVEELVDSGSGSINLGH